MIVPPLPMLPCLQAICCMNAVWHYKCNSGCFKSHPEGVGSMWEKGMKKYNFWLSIILRLKAGPLKPKISCVLSG